LSNRDNAPGDKIRASLRSPRKQRVIETCPLDDEAASARATQEIVDFGRSGTPAAANAEARTRNSGIVEERGQVQCLNDVQASGRDNLEPIGSARAWVD
jgi:hypothetical protein